MKTRLQTAAVAAVAYFAVAVATATAALPGAPKTAVIRNETDHNVRVRYDAAGQPVNEVLRPGEETVITVHANETDDVWWVDLPGKTLKLDMDKADTTIEVRQRHRGGDCRCFYVDVERTRARMIDRLAQALDIELVETRNGEFRVAATGNGIGGRHLIEGDVIADFWVEPNHEAYTPHQGKEREMLTKLFVRFSGDGNPVELDFLGDRIFLPQA